MIEPKDILLYTGAALAAYLIYKGILAQSKKFEREETSREKKAIEKQSREEITKGKAFMLSWKDNTGKTKIANLDTLAKYLESALRGSFWGEDEEQIREVLNSIPVSVKGKSGISYPIQSIAIRYAINTNGKNLKSDLIKLLSANELKTLGVSKHLKYL
jgi:hypothetical protein